MIGRIQPFKMFPYLYYNGDEVKTFLDFSKRSVIALLLALLATSFIFYKQIPDHILYIWIALHLGYLVHRSFEFARLKKAVRDASEEITRTLKRNIILMGVGGILWGSSIWIAVLYASEDFVFYLIGITFGLSAGAIATLSPLFIGFVFFSGSIVILQFSAFIYAGGPFDYILAGLTFVFGGIIISAGRSNFTTLRENHQLANHLKASQKELFELNKSLEKNVEEKTAKIMHDYYHDTLTGLPNILSCHESLKTKMQGFIILLDVSDFTLINKQYGKENADQVLIAIAHHLKRNLLDWMQLFKGESDRFIIHAHTDDPSKIEDFCKRIFAFFDLQEIEVGEHLLNVTFSIGIAPVEEGLETMINSEYALDASKKSGRKNYFFFRADADKVKLEKELYQSINMTKALIENDAIFPFFQPIKDIKNHSIYKYEVLARGKLDGEIIAPYRFLEPAKRIGLITTITKIIISKSFAFFEKNDFEFSINITEEDLVQDYLLEFLKIKFNRHHINPSRVTFEILENINIYADNEKVSYHLAELKRMGCKIAIDDFGVENSNFLRLLELDFDYIKLDGVFIKILDQSPKSQKIVETIVKFSKALDIKVVAEFVENREIYELLETYGVDFAQGYYIAKPSEELYGAVLV